VAQDGRAAHSQFLRVNNAQVGALASSLVSSGSSPATARSLSASHLVRAKAALLDGHSEVRRGGFNPPQETLRYTWVVGFTSCLESLYTHLARVAGVSEHLAREAASNRLEARFSAYHERFRVSDRVLQHVASHNALDNSLHEWARRQACSAPGTARTAMFVGCGANRPRCEPNPNLNPHPRSNPKPKP